MKCATVQGARAEMYSGGKKEGFKYSVKGDDWKNLERKMFLKALNKSPAVKKHSIID